MVQQHKCRAMYRWWLGWPSNFPLGSEFSPHYYAVCGCGQPKYVITVLIYIALVIGMESTEIEVTEKISVKSLETLSAIEAQLGVSF
jgi:hypothetical protein